MMIALDMDDVLVEFYSDILYMASKDLGLSLSYEGTTDWDDTDLKRAVFSQGSWWDWLEENWMLWATCPPVEGALKGVRQLRDLGHRVDLLTSKPAWAEKVVWDWLKVYKPAVQGVTIVPPGAPKSAFSEAWLLVDDNPENIRSWLRTGRPAIVFDRPWNQEEIPRARRVRSWPELVDVIGAAGDPEPLLDLLLPESAA
jgi:5'(3')-deoxyribonucleotidase